MRIRNYFFGAALLFVFPIAQAGPLTISTSNPDLIEIYGVSNLIDASDIEGLTATVTFGDFTEESVLWAATGGTSGGASGAGWSLSSTGNALFGATLSNTGSLTILHILLSGFEQNYAFDLGDAYGIGRTAGADIGSPFAVTDSSEDLDLVVTYANAYYLSGSPVVGDLYSDMGISINGGGLQSGDYLTFSTDMDLVDRTGSSASVPEPAPLILLGLGITILSIHRRRKFRLAFF